MADLTPRGDELPPVLPGPRAGDHPISHQQEGLLGFMARLTGRHSYQMSYGARIAGQLDPVGCQKWVRACDLRRRAGR
jgi:hypothetical protein